MKKKYFFTTLQRVERGYNRIVQERSYYFSMVWKGLNNKSTHFKEKKSVKKREIYKYKIIFLFNKFKKVWSKGGQQCEELWHIEPVTVWPPSLLHPADVGLGAGSLIITINIEPLFFSLFSFISRRSVEPQESLLYPAEPSLGIKKSLLFARDVAIVCCPHVECTALSCECVCSVDH